MVILSFRNKKEKEHLLEKARKMEELSSMIVDCIEESETEDESSYRRSYRDDEEGGMDERMSGRYRYRRGSR